MYKRQIKLQHRVSLVKFASDESDNIGNDFINNNYNRSQIVTELKSYTTKNISDLTSTVNSLIAAGATRADFGLNQAQRAFQLGGTREGAQKVVVFFTDGQPTSNSDWSNSVAAAAITNAKELKDANALIYSIGVFRDANPVSYTHLDVYKRQMMNRVLFVERSGELRWLARLSTEGAEPKGNQV